jgi:SAM-dependent methyltransferase
MRKNVKQFVAIVAECFTLHEPIYEFGSFQVSGQEGSAGLRLIFPGREYVGADIREGPGVDKVLDLHKIDLPSQSVGSVLCIDTLEHVEYPHKALEEIYRILLPFGMTVISSVMDFGIHNYPNDYWRFTPAAFKSLLKPFKHSFVGSAGRESFPHTIVGIGFKGDVPDLSKFIDKYQRWRKIQKYQFKQIVKHFIDT